jgi:hypothetical protein
MEIDREITCIEIKIIQKMGEKMGPLFFMATREATKQITELFDFMWPTVASLWNMRWQVDGYRAVKPDATEQELHNRFIYGSEIQSISFKKSFVEQQWSYQRHIFSKILLTNIFTIHESWIHDVLTVLNANNRTNRGNLQFPTDTTDPDPNKHQGLWVGINNLCSNESLMLKNAYYQPLKQHRKNTVQNIDNLMKCYRYFKEIRNCLTHNGGKADQKLIDAYNEFNQVATPANLGMNEVPMHYSFSVGEEVRVDMRGVVGFCEVVLRIIVTCDCELSRSQAAESEYTNVWRIFVERGRTLKQDANGRVRQLERYSTKMGLPVPQQTNEIEAFTLNNGLVFQ